MCAPNLTTCHLGSQYCVHYVHSQCRVHHVHSCSLTCTVCTTARPHTYNLMHTPGRISLHQSHWSLVVFIPYGGALQHISICALQLRRGEGGCIISCHKVVHVKQGTGMHHMSPPPWHGWPFASLVVVRVVEEGMLRFVR